MLSMNFGTGQRARKIESYCRAYQAVTRREKLKEHICALKELKEGNEDLYRFEKILEAA